jgi:tetratricopeptide (TPR) repeat protein
MDPITRVSKLFLAEAETFWRTGHGRVLPMIAEPSDRGELVKTLRVREIAPDNRWPLFLYEEPFVNPARYFNRLAGLIERDYERVRGGIGKDGLVLPPFAVPREARDDRGQPLARAVWAVERAAALLSLRFDGALIALVPSHVDDGCAWRDSIDTVRGVRFSAHARVAVYDPPGGPLAGLLGPRGAHLRIDQDELFAYFRKLGGSDSKGPPVAMPPSASEEQRRALEATGDRLPSPGVSVTLRGLLLEGANQIVAGRYKDAAQLYREARSLCAAEQLVLVEAMVLMALGGACLGAGVPTLAIESYRRAAELAQTKEAWQVVCQAWLGAGGAHLTSKSYAPAAQAYRAAAEVAERGEVAVLRVEALRMAGTCLLLGGSEHGAVLAWKEAVAAGAKLAEPARRASTLREVTMVLTELLKRLGLNQQAAHVQSLHHGGGDPLAEPRRGEVQG